MRAHRAEFRVTTMARVLGVSTSGFYAWLKRPRSAREKSDTALAERVRAIHERSRGTYGAPRIQAELADCGFAVSRKRVARLMRESGLAGISRRKRPTTTRRAASVRPAPDLVDRQFVAEAPDRLWVADITYVPTLAGFVYLSIVLDVFSRRIVGWAMNSSLATGLVLSALEMAIAQRRPECVIHHSDQGSQYTSLTFGNRCRDAGIALSMGSVGDCYDNAMSREPPLRQPRVRAARPDNVPKSRRSESGTLSLHRGLVQYPSSPFRDRTTLTRQLRRGVPRGRLIP